MTIFTSTAKEPAPGSEIIRRFNKKRAKGVDVGESLGALKDKVAEKFPDANWIFDLKWEESGSETIASGRPYQLG